MRYYFTSMERFRGAEVQILYLKNVFNYDQEIVTLRNIPAYPKFCPYNWLVRFSLFKACNFLMSIERVESFDTIFIACYIGELRISIRACRCCNFFRTAFAHD